MQDALGRVTQVIDTYFEMLHKADCALVAQVFHPEAHVQSCSDGKIISIDMEGFKTRMRTRPVPCEIGEAKNGRLASLAFATESMALATVTSTMLSLFFVDTLVLLEVKGQWKIISKVFCSYPAEASRTL